MSRSTLRQACLTALLGVTAAALAPWAAEAQDPESVLQQVAEVHVKPGGIPVFEAAHGVRNERKAQAGVSFVTRSAVSESLVYRFVTPVRDWDGLGQRAEEMSGMPPAPAGSPDGNSAIDHVDSYLRWSRPDLGYQPQNPRLQTADWQAMQLVRIHVIQGKMGDVIDVLEDAKALYARHGVREGYAVYIRGLGEGAPMVELQFWGSSMSDLYAASERLEARIGSELDGIRARAAEVSRSIEVHNFMIRRDLNYQPAS